MPVDVTAVLRLLGERKFKPLRPEKLLERLRLDEGDLVELEVRLTELQSAGALTRGSDGTVGLVKGVRLATGRIELNRRGFAFVRQEEPGDEDIYIDRNGLGASLDGDLVLVELGPGRRFRGRLSGGKVALVLERAHRLIVGTYERWRNRGAVRPDAVGLQREIRIPDEHRADAKVGQKVVVELVERADQLAGRIKQVLGNSDDPTVDLPLIVAQFGLPTAFPGEALRQAQGLVDAFAHEKLTGRTDLRDELIVTIDPADAQDFDDAISLRTLRDGWELGVHIADVSHFVRPDSPIWEEAVERATSVYLPGHTIHMLPEELSAGLCSLRPREDHLTKSVFIRFDRDAFPRQTRLERSVIRSSARLNYEQAARAIAGEQADVGPEVTVMLKEADRLAGQLNAVRNQRGALELNLPEVKIVLDDMGMVKEAKVPPRLSSHKLIEECMIAANEAVARTMFQRSLPLVSRVHQEPEEKSLKDLFLFARTLGLSVGKDYGRKAVQRLLKSVEGTPIEYAVHMIALRSLKKAIYSSRLRGHYALAASDYCHFTSPIRRLPDLIVHAVLDSGYFKSTLEPFDPGFWESKIEAWAIRSSELERRAEAAEREMIQLKLLRHLSRNVGQTMMGTVVGVQEFGAFVELDDIPVEGLIRLRDLSDDHYEFAAGAHTLTGRRRGRRIRLGDRVRVIIEQVDLERREVDLLPAPRR